MFVAIGTISGTSMDAIDVAAINTDGADVVQSLGGCSQAYTSELASSLRRVVADPDNFSQLELSALSEQVAIAFAKVIEPLIAKLRVMGHEVSLVGFHGQTVLHRPEKGISVQLGDAQLLANMLGLPVVGDFRSADVAMGGQGAPLTPLYHRALLRKEHNPAADEAGDIHTHTCAASLLTDELSREYHSASSPAAILNLGGVGNITFSQNLSVGEVKYTSGGESTSSHEHQVSHEPEARSEYKSSNNDDSYGLLAFDTGPANAVLDDFVAQRLGWKFDLSGLLCAQGRVDVPLVEEYMTHPYFQYLPPKSLDRNEFHKLIAMTSHLSNADGAATIAEITVRSVVAAFAHAPIQPLRCWVAGGGRRNLHIMSRLAAELPMSVEDVNHLGVDGDLIEAEAFGYLAVRSMLKLPLSFPATTGVAKPCLGGVIYNPTS